MSAVDSVVKLGFLLNASDQMSNVIENSVKKSLDSLNKFEQSVAKVSKSAMMIGKRATMLGAGIAGAMLTGAKKVADFGAEISNAAQRTGIGVVDFQKLMKL